MGEIFSRSITHSIHLWGYNNTLVVYPDMPPNFPQVLRSAIQQMMVNYEQKLIEIIFVAMLITIILSILLTTFVVSCLMTRYRKSIEKDVSEMLEKRLRVTLPRFEQ